MAERVATCIRCRKSFKLGMDAYHEYAHLIGKVEVISRISTNKPCTTKSVRVDEKGPFESTLFFDIRQMA